jgi:hypothetical protein
MTHLKKQINWVSKYRQFFFSIVPKAIKCNFKEVWVLKYNFKEGIIFKWPTCIVRYSNNIKPHTFFEIVLELVTCD